MCVCSKPKFYKVRRHLRCGACVSEYGICALGAGQCDHENHSWLLSFFAGFIILTYSSLEKLVIVGFSEIVLIFRRDAILSMYSCVPYKSERCLLMSLHFADNAGGSVSSGLESLQYRALYCYIQLSWTTVLHLSVLGGIQFILHKTILSWDDWLSNTDWKNLQTNGPRAVMGKVCKRNCVALFYVWNVHELQEHWQSHKKECKARCKDALSKNYVVSFGLVCVCVCVSTVDSNSCVNCQFSNTR